VRSEALAVVAIVTLSATDARPAPPPEPGRSQARSMVISRYGIVATEQTLASQIGAGILARGGTAVDAAVAANAAMGLVAPMMDGIGGDLFAIVYEAKTGKYYGLNASGWAPAGLRLEDVAKAGVKDMKDAGVHTVTVPGAVDGWDKLLGRFGKLKMADVLAPSIRLAEEGFPVTEIVQSAWQAQTAKLKHDANAARTYLPGGRAPHVGEVFRNPDLAWSYKQLAARGRDAFYKGAIGQRVVDYDKRLGGKMTAADLADFSAEWVDPISTTYRGWTVHEIPPNGQGIAALMMLNLMETFPPGDMGRDSARALHTMIEAKKLAYADLARYVADPKHARIPVAGLLGKGYASARAKLIDPAHAADAPAPGQPMGAGTDTTYLCAVDRWGNMVSLIQSNFEAFGSGLVADGTGFVLHNRGALFSLEPAHPNALAGRKRPLHTIIPAFMSKGDVRIAFGIMGGFNQAQAHAQFVSHIVDHGLNIQAALEAPRFTKLTFPGRDVVIENRFTPEVRRDLEGKGHQLTVVGNFSGTMGGGQSVMRDFAAGVNYGASDPRKDGAAVPEPLPQP
jgi:gamma-glutamyltranspeptidase/glutathione hydrolase